MRSLLYVASLVVAIAIGMFQGPLETGIALTSQGGYEPDCTNSGVDSGADCPGSNCSDTYDAEKTAKPWTEKEFSATSDCVATGCTFSWSINNRTDECTQVD